MASTALVTTSRKARVTSTRSPLAPIETSTKSSGEPSALAADTLGADTLGADTLGADMLGFGALGADTLAVEPVGCAAARRSQAPSAPSAATTGVESPGYRPVERARVRA